MIDDIKELVTQVLDKQGVLARLRAELRASVFAAIDEEDRRNNTGGLSKRSLCKERVELWQNPTGLLVAALVKDFLVTCKMTFTLKLVTGV